jgi:hypothetical protein
MIGVYAAPGHGIAGQYSFHGILWAIYHAVIILEADAAAYTKDDVANDVGFRPISL